MYTRYCFSRSNFLVEFVAGIGGALVSGVPGVIVGSFYGSVYPEIGWGGLTGEPAAGMLGLLISATVGGWLMVYFIGQMIHDHRSGLVSFIGSITGMVAAIFLFDYSYQPWFTLFVLTLPIVAAAFGYNLPIPRAIQPQPLVDDHILPTEPLPVSVKKVRAVPLRIRRTPRKSVKKTLE